jgi:hypothetical protein
MTELGDFREVSYLVQFLRRMREGRVGRQQEVAS